MVFLILLSRVTQLSLSLSLIYSSSALVGNPNFAIIDEAYPYIARRLMTDRSPRLRAALRYMVYGKEGVFDAENLIDLLQALEKFNAVRDEGDGSAFKMDGVRGNKVVGSAGDFRGSQKVDTSERETDIDGGRFRVSSPNSAIVPESQIPVTATTAVNDAKTVREALRFFFGPDGEVFREFMLEEIVTVVDASSRETLQELARSLGLRNVPVPSFLRALNPKLTEEDRRVSADILGTSLMFLYLLLFICLTLLGLPVAVCAFRWYNKSGNLSNFC